MPGITSKVDYLKHLGVDVLWCSPMYKSPQADMGYDISDYKDIDSLYGKLEDVDKLIAELKKRDMKMMMDLVVNHTSDHVGPTCQLLPLSRLKLILCSMHGSKSRAPPKTTRSVTGTYGSLQSTTKMATVSHPITGV